MSEDSSDQDADDDDEDDDLFRNTNRAGMPNLEDRFFMFLMPLFIRHVFSEDEDEDEEEEEENNNSDTKR